MDSEYLISIADGRLVFRTEANDEHVNLKPVPHEIVQMILKGEVEPMDVANAISAKIKENGEFNLQEYVEGLKKLNVRVSNPQKEARAEQKLRDRSSETISVEEFVAKKARVAKATAAIAPVQKEVAPKLAQAKPVKLDFNI